MISKNRICDITKKLSFLVSHIYIYIYIYIYMYIYIYIYISQNPFFIQKIIRFIFLISQNRFCDIKNRFAYIKFDFVISQRGGFTVHTGLFQDFINNNLKLSQN